MKKSIKRIAISLCSVFVIAAAAGCGGDGGKNKDGKTTIENLETGFPWMSWQYPQKNFAINVTVSRCDSFTIRFHQVWPGEPLYYNPEDFSSGDERVFSVID